MRQHLRRIGVSIGAFPAAALIAACADTTPMDPTTRIDEALGVFGVGSPCAVAPDYVVADRDAFLEALTSAPAGSTIAIDGMIEVDFDGNVETADLTFDCATPGSGLAAAGDPAGIWLFIVKAPGVTVKNLVLDARQSSGGAYLADMNGGDALAERVSLIANTVRCRSTECVLVQSGTFAGASGATVTDNAVETSGDGMGIHLQGYEHALIARNSVHSENAANRAILIVGSRDIDVERNVTTGQWTRAISLLDGVSEARIRSNELRGGGFQSVAFVSVERVDFVGNDVECGEQFCLVGQGGSDVTIERNTFVSTGSRSGINLFGGYERAVVRGNLLATSGPSTDPQLGGVRVRTGSGHVIEQNEVTGPWANGIAVRDVRESLVRGNVTSGAVGVGALFLETSASEIAANVVSGPGGAGMRLEAACQNQVIGNTVDRALTDPTVLFGRATGSNRYVGNPNTVHDFGAFDCDGDGLPDPNTIEVGAR